LGGRLIFVPTLRLSASRFGLAAMIASTCSWMLLSPYCLTAIFHRLSPFAMV
jgi:hypothetical protein